MWSQRTAFKLLKPFIGFAIDWWCTEHDEIKLLVVMLNPRHRSKPQLSAKGFGNFLPSVKLFLSQTMNGFHRRRCWQSCCLLSLFSFARFFAWWGSLLMVWCRLMCFEYKLISSFFSCLLRLFSYDAHLKHWAFLFLRALFISSFAMAGNRIPSCKTSHSFEYFSQVKFVFAKHQLSIFFWIFLRSSESSGWERFNEVNGENFSFQ